MRALADESWQYPMKYAFGLLMILWVAAQEIIAMRSDIPGIAAILGALCLFIVKEKFVNRIWVSVVYFAAAVALSQYWAPFILLAAIPIADFVYSRSYWLAAGAFVIAGALSIVTGQYSVVVLLCAAAFAGWVLGAKDRNDREARSVLDQERRLRYSLEQAQNELIRSRKEIESLTEARERNRIAHELHDSIGHGIAGVLIQLEAALRIHRRDADKTEEVLRACRDKLSETLTLTRNTVYNIRSDVKTGVEALKGIIAEFKYCPVTFEHSGDFSAVSPTNMRILEANVREALTNSARHSHATEIAVRVDIRKKNVRLYYKDNGIGCGDIHEHMGLGGMRERVRDAGGTLSADGSDGFLIVCNLPEQSGDEEDVMP